MKKSIYAFAVLFALSFTAFAQEEQKTEVNTDPNAPEIIFEKAKALINKTK